MNNIEFARPLFLSVLPLSLLLTGLLLWWRPGLLGHGSVLLSPAANIRYRHPAIQWFRAYARQQQNRSRIRDFIIHILGWWLMLILLHLSLAQPYRVGARLPDPPSHRDIVFIVDTSVSMVLDDYLVNNKRSTRMAMLQTVMHHFIDQLQGNRIGVVVYSEQVYTLVPLSTDYQLIKQQFKRIVPAVLTGRTSNPGKALLYTLEQYKGQNGDEKPTLVLISDVNRPDREIDPRIAASYLQQQGFRLHTVAIGAGSYAAQNRQATSLVYHPTNYALLKAIAEQGQGHFFTAHDSQSIHQALLNIQQVEKRQVKTEPQFIKHMLYQWPLLLALLLLSLQQIYRVLRGRA